MNTLAQVILAIWKRAVILVRLILALNSRTLHFSFSQFVRKLIKNWIVYILQKVEVRRESCVSSFGHQRISVIFVLEEYSLKYIYDFCVKWAVQYFLTFLSRSSVSLFKSKKISFLSNVCVIRAQIMPKSFPTGWSDLFSKHFNLMSLWNISFRYKKLNIRH